MRLTWRNVCTDGFNNLLRPLLAAAAVECQERVQGRVDGVQGEGGRGAGGGGREVNGVPSAKECQEADGASGCRRAQE